MEQLEDLLQQCTVKISVPRQRGWGTGFFVTPNLILTCTHVVNGIQGKVIQVQLPKQNTTAQACVESSFPEPFDISLLRVDLPKNINTICVYLDEDIQSRDPLYTFGYPDQDFPYGCPVTFSCEGFTGDEPPLIKFASGQVRPGMSGSPLLNQRTGRVCGIVKFTRDRSIDLGGGAITSKTIFSKFPKLALDNQEFHKSNLPWIGLLPQPSPLVQLDRTAYIYRQILLSKVNNYWIKRVLENSLYNKFPINIKLERCFDILALGYEIPEITRQSIPENKSIIDIFDELGSGQTTLILGSPGSGKTIMLLVLANILIKRAKQDVNLPIPVVLNLSSWKNAKQKIEHWLIQELYTNYQVLKPLGKSWIEKQQLLLLLDGLDEVKKELREDCVQAINQFYMDHGKTEIVVCSRTKAYRSLSHQFNFQEAILIAPLQPEQLSDYLDKAGSSLLNVKSAMQKDSVLKELAKNPLMLSVMAVAYQDFSVKNLQQMSLGEGRKYLFDRYIDRLFERRKGKCPYSEEQMRHWLSFLAQKMIQESQTLFFIENIQSSWLQSSFQKIMHGGLVGIISGLIIELLFAVPVGLIAGSLSGEMFFGLTCGILLGVSRELRKSGLMAIGVLLIVLGALVYVINIIGVKIGFEIGAADRGALYSILIGGVVLVLRSFDRLRKPDIKKTTRFNQETWNAFTNSLIASFVGFCLLVVPVVLFLTTSKRISLAALLGVIHLLCGGSIYIEHLTMRSFIWWSGNAPWNYPRFLKWAERELFLQRIGVSFQFPHSLLRDQWQKNSQPSLQDFLGRHRLIKLIITIIFVSLILISLFIPLSFDTIRVRENLSNSTSTILQAGDRLIINMLIYKFSEPKLGDIIVYREKEGKRSLAQVSGLPAQHLELTEKQMYVCGQRLDGTSFIIPPKFYSLISSNSAGTINEDIDITCIHRFQIVGKANLPYWRAKRPYKKH
jgi:energy-coupling factor transporter ATP-binding protein EcfA2